MSFKHLGVLGAGQMGAGIAQVAALSGLEVQLADQSLDHANQGKATIEKRLSKAVQKEKLTQEQAQLALDQIHPVGELQAFESVEFAIEAATENKALKFDLFKKLDSVCSDSAVLATNTSSISITEIAATTSRPEKVVGMHFMNPVPVMKLVEGIRGLQTSDKTFDSVKKLSQTLGKTFIEVTDQPGFAVNRILMPMINEAIFALFEGVASVEDIDAAMTLGTHQPMGPLTLADFIGLDTCESILNVMHEGLGDPKYRPCPLLKKYVAAGWLGKKTRRGFYRYDL